MEFWNFFGCLQVFSYILKPRVAVLLVGLQLLPLKSGVTPYRCMKGGWYGSVEPEAGRKYRKILVGRKFYTHPHRAIWVRKNQKIKGSQSWRSRAKRRSGNISDRIRVSNDVALVGLGFGMSTRKKGLFPSC